MHYFRPIWRHHYHNTQGLIFVVDSTDRERIDDAREELHKMLLEEELRAAVVLIFANKQDMQNTMTIKEITEKTRRKHTQRQNLVHTINMFNHWRGAIGGSIMAIKECCYT